MRKLFTLDLATRTGWASAPPDVPTTGDVRHGVKLFPSTGDDVGAFLDAYDTWINDMLTVEKTGLVVFEAPILSSGKMNVSTSRKLMGLAGHTELVCRRRGIPCREVNISTVKKELAGTGHADKGLMISAARAEGFDVVDDNAADACGIWKWALNVYTPDHYKRLFGMGALGSAAQ